MSAAAAKPASNRVLYGPRYERSRHSTARRLPPTSACASRTGPATLRSYSRSASAGAVSRPSICASRMKRRFSIARRCRCVYRSVASGASPAGPRIRRTVLLSPGISRTASTSRRSKESIRQDPSSRWLAVDAFVGPRANHLRVSDMESSRSARAYSCTGSPSQRSSIRRRRSAGICAGWSV